MRSCYISNLKPTTIKIICGNGTFELGLTDSISSEGWGKGKRKKWQATYWSNNDVLLSSLLDTMVLFYCNGLIECPTTLLPFIMVQHAHFWFRHTPACPCLQIGHIHDCCWYWTRLLLLLGSLIVFPFFCCCNCCFDLSLAYNHNKIKGIPNAKNMPIVRIGIRNTNKDIPKHNVANPRVKIQRFVRVSTIYWILAPP